MLTTSSLFWNLLLLQYIVDVILIKKEMRLKNLISRLWIVQFVGSVRLHRYSVQKPQAASRNAWKELLINNWSGKTTPYKSSRNSVPILSTLVLMNLNLTISSVFLCSVMRVASMTMENAVTYQELYWVIKGRINIPCSLVRHGSPKEPSIALLILNFLQLAKKLLRERCYATRSN